MPERSALHFDVFGTVQGVGSRPLVHRLATGLGLDGWAANIGGHVEGAVAGSPCAAQEFTARLRTGAPVPVRVRRVRVTSVRGQSPPPGSGFAVRCGEVGRAVPRGPRGIPPAVAIGATCLSEPLDPGDAGSATRLSTQWARARSPRRIAVQHHHAHVAACAAEHGLIAHPIRRGRLRRTGARRRRDAVGRGGLRHGAARPPTTLRRLR